MPKLVKKAKTAKDLQKSRKIRKDFLTRFGLDGKIPTSILRHDRKSTRRDKFIDLSIEKKGGNYSAHFKKNTKKLASSSDYTPGIDISTLKFQNRSNYLSAFPQNVGSILTDLYCPEGGTVYDPFCVTGDTLISTIEGDIPIKELVGKKCYVFCSNGKETKLRKAYNIRKTRSDAKILRIHLYNGKHLDLTPNHEIMATSGEWIKAKDLQPKQSLMPFYRMISHGRWAVQTEIGKYKRQSRFVYEQLNNIKIDIKNFDIHHKNENKLDDTPDNLEYISKSDHGKIHHKKGVAPYKVSKKTKIKRSKLMTGKKNHFYGKKHSDETKMDISSKMSKINKGRKHTQKTKKLMSEKRKDKSYIPIVQKLLKEKEEKNLTYKQIAKIANVHVNTVMNIKNGKFKYNHKIKSIEYLDILQDVYNMEVEEFNNFAANGVIVHNCGHNSRMQMVFELGLNYHGVDICHEFMEDNKKIAKLLYKRRETSLKITKKDNWIQLHEISSDNVPLSNDSCDFTITSPPYWNLEYYGPEKEQLGNSTSYDYFLTLLEDHIVENYRVLRPGSFCIYNANDFRRNKKFYPFHLDLYMMMCDIGFEPFNIYILDQGNTTNQLFAQDVIKHRLLPKQHEFFLVMRVPGPDWWKNDKI